MPAKIIILTPILFFLALLQGSFLPHFAIFGYTPNFVFFLVIFLILLAPSLGLISSVLGGVFLDIFSTHFFGFNVLILLGILIFIKVILKKYVRFSLG